MTGFREEHENKKTISIKPLILTIMAANPDGSVWFVDDTFKRNGRLSPEGNMLRMASTR